MAETVVRPGRRIVARMAVPVRVAVDASAALDAGRLHAILEMRQEEVRDSH
jgi:hypothetical protein